MIHVLINGNNFNTAILDEALEEIPKDNLYLIYVSRNRFGAARVLELYAKKNGLPYVSYESIECISVIDIIITILKGHPSPEMKKIMEYNDDFTKHVLLDKRIKKVTVVDYDDLPLDEASCDDIVEHTGYDSNYDDIEDDHNYHKYDSYDSAHDEYEHELDYDPSSESDVEE